MTKMWTCIGWKSSNCNRLHPTIPSATRCMRRYERRMQKLGLDSDRQIVRLEIPN